MSVKKVLLFTRGAHRSGKTRHLFNLAKSMGKENISSYVVLEDGYPFSERLDRFAYQTIYLSFGLLFFWSLLKIIWLVKKEGIRVVHLHGDGTLWLAFFLKLIWRGKIVYTFHSLKDLKSSTEKIKSLIKRGPLSLADKHICLSNSEKNDILKSKLVKKYKLKVINNGIDVEYIRSRFNNIEVKAARQHFGLAADRFSVGGMTRLDTHVIGTLADFVGQWKKKHGSTPFNLYVAGGGKEEDSLRRMLTSLGIDEEMPLLGDIHHPVTFLRSLDVYISCSFAKEASISDLEAMCAPVPCLLSDTMGHRSLKDDGSCLLFDVNNFDDFEAKLTKLIEDTSYTERIKLAAVNTIQENYTLEKMVASTTALYNTLK